eukprot:TRINITY_DN31169_c0_g1_i3.p1 TRINITY_DN31169_c0_g1~~TRINITY_DN31169_c0_g1_i3.p1  ORF type:complete len:180 (-),score=19.25 TRINITY_DN31169_c0_g1_i3:875-1414(-)
MDQFINLPSVKSYPPLIHEAVLLNLLELLFYHRSCVDQVVDSDMMIDLLEYCYRKLVRGAEKRGDAQQRLKLDHDSDAVLLLQEQIADVDLKICISAISVARYILETDASVLGASAQHKLLHQHDWLLALVALLESAPWVEHNRDHQHGDGGMMTRVYEDKSVFIQIYLFSQKIIITHH